MISSQCHHGLMGMHCPSRVPWAWLLTNIVRPLSSAHGSWLCVDVRASLLRLSTAAQPLLCCSLRDGGISKGSVSMLIRHIAFIGR